MTSVRSEDIVVESQTYATGQPARLCSCRLLPTGSNKLLQLAGTPSHRTVSTSAPFLGGSTGRLRAQDEDKSYKVKEGASGGTTPTTSQEGH